VKGTEIRYTANANWEKKRERNVSQKGIRGNFSKGRSLAFVPLPGKMKTARERKKNNLEGRREDFLIKKNKALTPSRKKGGKRGGEVKMGNLFVLSLGMEKRTDKERNRVDKRAGDGDRGEECIRERAN